LVVKEYPVTEQVLDNIGTLRFSCAFFAAIGSLALGFALSCWQSIDLASGEAAATLATWTVYMNVGFFIAGVSYLAALIYYFKSESVIEYVKKHTVHDTVE
jgi:hypothetical protein